MITWRTIKTRSGRPDPYAIEGHVNGAVPYTVCRIVVGGRETFAAWTRGATEALSRHDTAQEAREACQAHWEARHEAS